MWLGKMAFWKSNSSRIRLGLAAAFLVAFSASFTLAIGSTSIGVDGALSQSCHLAASSLAPSEYKPNKDSYLFGEQRLEGAHQIVAPRSTQEPFLLAGRPSAGNPSDLTFVYEALIFLGRTLINTSNLLLLFAGLFMLSIWLVSPEEEIFALAGSACILGALLFTLALWKYMPPSFHTTWRFILYICEAGFIIFMSMLLLAFAQAPLNKYVSFAFVALGSIAPITYAVGGARTEAWLDQVWTVLMILVYVYANIRLALHCVQTKQRFAIALLIQSLIFFVLALRDYHVLTNTRPKPLAYEGDWSWLKLLFEPIYLSHLSLLLLLLVMGGVLIGKYKTQLKQATQAKQHLQESLQRQKKRLTLSHKSQMRQERMKVINQERERIYQDVHDGIGSRLIATLFSIRKSILEPAALEAQLQSCLDDLRLVINTQLDNSKDIQSAIFDYCLSIEMQIERGPLAIAYDVSDGPAIHLLPLVHLNVLRILQESIANVIKHANATLLLVTLHQTATSIRLTVTDNGVGLPVSLLDKLNHNATVFTGGRGLLGLRTRAERIGGQLAISPAHPGTKIDLAIPIACAPT